MRRYEITHLDSDGRRRWQTVKGYDDLDEAQGDLVRINHKLRRGERVAPSKQTFDQIADEWLAQLRVFDHNRQWYPGPTRMTGATGSRHVL